MVERACCASFTSHRDGKPVRYVPSWSNPVKTSAEIIQKYCNNKPTTPPAFSNHFLQYSYRIHLLVAIHKSIQSKSHAMQRTPAGEVVIVPRNFKLLEELKNNIPGITLSQLYQIIKILTQNGFVIYRWKLCFRRGYWYESRFTEKL